MERQQELATGLEKVRSQVTTTCEDAGRDPAEVTLVVVTKTYPASDIRALAGLGVRDVGESRDQEASAKVEESSDLDLTWHFIGRLQSNKARAVARYAHTVHSLDRASLVPGLSRGATEAGRTLRCFLQISLDGDPTRGGAPVKDIPALADAIASAESLQLAGLMAVPPVTWDPNRAFSDLLGASAHLIQQHPEATGISGGMTSDFVQALRHGATHLRVGSAVLGQRPPLR
ncbi:YggS family pyridoxal phosphate-dependent enzyme [Kineosporia succinea]|uniref:Pyridoxal phosphate homeostasis protein n=1 Tax=Kineosporia succinea TaxID=84632 RepID=A0ABT9P6I4_9ACTN|nr:YggS family pyridoxal phosphate-dependent enzyme [Kineosporia succinea]MDP9828304.1 pyridoxal phosphate enzyme (YggS family) [Kineosporia succinea]